MRKRHRNYKRCSQADLGKYGYPVMFSRANGAAFGASTERTKFPRGEPIILAIWLSNESRRDVQTGGCSFLEDHIHVFDSTGRRLLSKAEQEDIRLRRQGRQSIRVCSESLPLMNRRPGFCGVIGGGDLNSAYDLVPGTYTLREKNAGAQSDEANAHSLSITVE